VRRYGPVGGEHRGQRGTPIAWPACRWTLNNVVAQPVWSIEIAASAAVWAGAIENPKNIPVPNISTGIAQPMIRIY
jgi:hypothetical protein